MPEELQREPLRSQVKNLLLERILAGDLAPGQALRLDDLAAQWGISRTPLREALVTLEQEGLVGYERGKGFHVWPLSASESVNLYQIAGALERLAVRTMERATDEMLEELETANARLREVQGDPDAMIRWDGRFHNGLVRHTRNQDLLEMIRKVRNRLYRYRFYGYEYAVTHDTDEKRKSLGDHAEIIDRLEAGEIQVAGDLLEQHWERGTKLMARWLDEPAMGPDYPSPERPEG